MSDERRWLDLRQELSQPDKELSPALSAIADGVPTLPDEPAWKGQQGTSSRLVKTFMAVSEETDDDVYTYDAVASDTEGVDVYWRTRREE